MTDVRVMMDEFRKQVEQNVRKEFQLKELESRIADRDRSIERAMRDVLREKARADDSERRVAELTETEKQLRATLMDRGMAINLFEAWVEEVKRDHPVTYQAIQAKHPDIIPF